MTNLLKSALIAAASVSLPAIASAQAVAVADVQGAVQKSAAFVAAMAQMKTTYATQIAAFETRSKALQAEIAPLVATFQAAQKANSPQATLQTQYTAIQTKQQAAQVELQRLSTPIARAQGYVEEQISAKLEAALKAAMVAKNVQLVVAPQATVSYQPTVDITDTIVTELNKAVPTASITPPAGWQPAGQAGQPGAQRPAAAPGR